MKYFTLWLPLLIVCVTTLGAQKQDYHWITGYGSNTGNPDFGQSILRFGDLGRVDTLSRKESKFDMSFLNVSISDEEGRLQFYTNGVGLNNHFYQLMENGDGMSGFPGSTGEEGGFALSQGGIAVNWPDETAQYFLILEKEEYFPFHEDHQFKTTGVLYSRIDMNSNEGEGQVLEKRLPFLQDTLENGKTTLTRHANGRDWWYIKHKLDDNTFYRILISVNGAEIIGEQTIGQPILQGAGRAVFSPDGNKYVIFNTINGDVGQFIDIYDFDRCTGLLSNPLKMHFLHDGGVGGVAISPNSRYLYHSANFYIYQFDLWADDISATRDTVAIYDGYIDHFPTRFFAAQLAPDGKIYIICPNGVPVMHTIKYPNEAGTRSQVEQHSVQLPTLNAFSIPNNPNYRLGPLDGSPCDTLGLDNYPIANFRADQDTVDYLEFFFQDLSYYEPDTWFWSFGDGNFSNEVSPEHTYAQDGIYPVCLTVSNENGSHTACDTLNLGIVNTNEELTLNIQPQLFPNPFQGQFSLVLNDYYPKQAELFLFDELGRRVHQQRIFHAWNTVDGSDWPNGLYFYEVWDVHPDPSVRERKTKLATGKIVKQE